MPKKPKIEAQPPKRPRGRPPRAGEPGRMVGIRLSPAERAAFDAAAEKAGLSLAEWMRATCIAALPAGVRRDLVM